MNFKFAKKLQLIRNAQKTCAVKTLIFLLQSSLIQSEKHFKNYSLLETNTKNNFKLCGQSSSTVLGQSPQHLKVGGSSPVTNGGTWRKKEKVVF